MSAIRAGYKQTEVGVIPEDWACSEIGDFIDLLTGFPFPSSGYAQSGTRLLRGSNVKRNCTDWSEELVQHWPLITADIRKYLLKVGDIVIAMDGSLVGRSFASLSDDDVPALLLQRVARIRTESVFQSYLRMWVCSSRFTAHCDLVKTTTAIPHISPGDIRTFKVAIPPTKAEQEAIAEALSDADALIESLEQLLAKKRHIKQGAMQELLAGKKRLPGFRGEWAVKLLGDFTDCTAGGTPSTNVPEYWGGSIRWMSSGELNKKIVDEVEGRITEAGLRNSSTKFIPGGCVLMGLAGQGKTRGTVAMNTIPLCTNQSIAAIFPNQSFDAKYLYYNLDRRYEELRELSAGDGGRGGLNLTIIRSLVVPFPDRDEQEAIAHVLSDMDAEIADLEAQLDKTRALKQGMMQKLLTGEIRLI